MDNRDFDLGQQIAKLQGTVEEGFKGVHQRQDTTNGRIGKAEIRLNELEKLQATSDGEKKGAQMTWGRIFAIIASTAAIVGAVLKIFESLP